MEQTISQDPRSIRVREALQEAIISLVTEKPYEKITITDITKKARLARHTYYNHYETKEDLINSVIDIILTQFFEMGKEMAEEISSDSHEVGKLFFKVCIENKELVTILVSKDLEHIFIKRLMTHMHDLYEKVLKHKIQGLNPALAAYIASFNAYSFIGVLIQWVHDDMRYSPEIMGELLDHFAGIDRKITAVDKFKNLID